MTHPIPLSPAESAALGCTHVVEVLPFRWSLYPPFRLSANGWEKSPLAGQECLSNAPSQFRHARPATPKEISHD